MVGVADKDEDEDELWVGTVGGLCPRASILRQPLVTAPPSPSRTNAIIDCQSLKATTNQTTSDKCLINSLLLPPENNDAIALSQSYVAIWLWQQTQTRPDPSLCHHDSSTSSSTSTSTSQNPKVSIQLPVRAPESFATCFITVAA